ncbi:RNA polymerase sigma factor [Candidatus Uabimicrobium amorphum]|uniref:RNA polymerase sigma factor n=1 Tax=Uabimicrobium amorphum TaxID=2596890 RepID=A0A5S9IU99_UABAM|nr:sigma-70 family RNA polymerase sigma factor [Candidatus Uabimicrobium amorphum]BBM88258.1 ECF RNA polymerase sigma factor SigW [Candidatus Uabimicrobium amorphum]
MEDSALARLVLLAQAGKRSELDRLFGKIQQPIFRYIYGITKDVHLAEDLLQEVFMIAFRKLWLLEEPKAFMTWIYRIASRVTFRHLRKKKVPVVFDVSLLEEQVEVKEDSLPLDIDLQQLISQVTTASRTVLFLRFIEKKSLKEISLILEIPLGTVKSRLNYGISQLQKINAKN